MNDKVDKQASAATSAQALYTDPVFTLTNEDADKVLKNAGLSRSDLGKLLYDDEIFACCDRREKAVVGTRWRIEGDNTDWLHAEISRWHETLVRRAMDAQWIGSSISELIWRRPEEDHNGIRLAAVEPRKIERFINQDGVLRYQTQSGSYIDVEPLKVLEVRMNASAANPYGDALLSRVYWAWFNKNYGEQFWSKYAERHASPLTVGKFNPRTNNQAEAQRHLNDLAVTLAQAISDGVIVITQDDEISFVNATSDGSAHQLFTRHHIQRIQKTIIGRVLTSELAGGSRAAQETDDNFSQILFDYDLTLCERVINEFIAKVLRLNGTARGDILFAYDRTESIDKERWERDTALMDRGMRFTEQYFIDQYHLEPIYFSLEQIERAARSERAANAAQKAGLSLSKKQELTPAAQALEDRVQAGMAEAPEPITREMIEDVVKNAPNDYQLLEDLVKLYGDRDPEGFNDWFGEALEIACAHGYHDADQGTL